MKYLLKKISIPIMERQLVLPSLAFAAGLASLPALAQDATQVSATAEAAQTEQLPTGFTEKSATVNGVRINYKIGGQGPAGVGLPSYSPTRQTALPPPPQNPTRTTPSAPALA